MDDRFQSCDSRRLLALMELEPGQAASSSVTADMRSGAPSSAPRIDGYQITGPLGRGGMGSVWSAVQLRAHRKVALKLMASASFGSDRARLRFEREVELAARLEHPSIARVYDSGVCDGACFYAMELIDGLTLDEYVARRKLSQRQVLQLMRDICLAVCHAHQRGVIHRDLKPSNILVTPDGQPHVVDFGLARPLSGDEGESANPTLTFEGQMAGTLAFMAPEQAAGQSSRLDTRTDVYGLGATLYLLLVGQEPHDQRGPRYQVIRRVADEEVRRPRQLNRQLDAELESLLLKALDRDPDRRYGSAGELANDIDRYLKGDPLEAAPLSARYRLHKFVRKHRLPLGIAAGLVLVLLAATVISSWQAVRATRARNAEARAAASEAAQRKQAEAVAGLLESVFAGLDPFAEKKGGPDLKTQLVAELDQIAASLDKDYAGDPLVRARLRATLGWTQLRLGEVAKAEALFKSALEEQRLHAAPDDPQTLTTLHHLGVAYASAGRIDEAVKLLEQVRDARMRTLGPDHPDTMAALANLGAAYADSGRINDAIKLFERLRGPIAEKLGPDHPYTLKTLENLATAYAQSGRTAEATALLEQARDQEIKRFGPDHPHTLHTLGNLALAYQNAGRIEDAIKLFEGVRDQMIKKLGAAHPDTMHEMSNLAFAYHAAGRTDDAIKIYEQALTTQTAALAARPSDATLLDDRGRLYGRLGRFREAVADFDRAIELDPDQHLYWHDGAVPLRLALGDVEGYRRRRTEELHRLIATKQDAGPHRVVKDACMMPLEGEELQIVLKLADRALAEAGMDWMAGGYAALTRGMAEYRTGQYKEAIEWLHKSADGAIPDRDIEASLFEAMAYHQLGQSQQAPAMLVNGGSLMDRYLSKPGESVLGTGPSDWVFCQVLRREADALIGPGPATAPATQPTNRN